MSGPRLPRGPKGEERPALRTPTAVITIGVDALAAIARFAGNDEERSPHLCGVCIRAEEIAATDGHRIVRVNPKSSPFCSISEGEWAQPVIVPRTFVDALVAVGRSIKKRDVRIAMASGDKVQAMVGGVEMFYPAAENMFPAIDEVLSRSHIRRGHEPPRNICINPSFFEDVHAVVQAVVGHRNGVSISGWGSLLDALHLHVDDVVKFALMPMSTPEAEAEAEALGIRRF